MTTQFLLVRHAAHDWIGRGLAGRMEGVAINAQGQRQAHALADRLAAVPLAALYCTPRERTLQTVQPIAAQRGMPVAVEAAFDEIDFGRWAGLTFEQLDAEPGWRDWVERRGSATPPGGERFAGVPVRAMEGLQRLRARHPDGNVLVVSHGDVIKAVLASLLGMSLDHLERFEIAPASISIVAMGDDWSQVKLVNGQEAMVL